MRKSRPETFTAIDLFSGAGGLTLGLRKAGFDVVGAIESDSIAAQTYSVNHNDVELWPRDIRRVTAKEVMEKANLARGELDLLAGCPPCQGFSSMRTKNGGKRILEPRNDLVFEFLRFTRMLRPKALMLENVPGLEHTGRMVRLRRQLRALGYEGDCRVVDAADYMVPQRRRRLIFVATRNGALPPAKPSRASRTVRDAIGELGKPGKGRDKLHNVPENRADHVKQLIRAIPKDGGSRTDAPLSFQLKCHKKIEGFFDVYGRMSWDSVAPTITGGCHNPSKGRFLHPSQNRTITLREAAILQTFPKRYYFSLDRGKERAALLIGNALPPELIRRVVEPIKTYVRGLRLGVYFGPVNS